MLVSLRDQITTDIQKFYEKEQEVVVKCGYFAYQRIVDVQDRSIHIDVLPESYESSREARNAWERKYSIRIRIAQRIVARESSMDTLYRITSELISAFQNGYHVLGTVVDGCDWQDVGELQGDVCINSFLVTFRQCAGMTH